MEKLLVLAYFSVLLLLCGYGVHRAHLVILCARNRKKLLKAARSIVVAEEELPSVTVQLPLYNEATVVARLLDAAATIDYPRDRLEIQVLDDSSDETREMAISASAK